MITFNVPRCISCREHGKNSSGMNYLSMGFLGEKVEETVYEEKKKLRMLCGTV